MVGIAATETLRREPAAADAAVAIPLAAALHVDQATWRTGKRAPCPARVEQRAAEGGGRQRSKRESVCEREVFVDNQEVTEGL